MMNLLYINSCDSTQKYLLEHLDTLNNTLVYTFYQTNGIGSRGNNWIGKKNNLFFSFVVDKSDLPTDLPIQSASIYFSYLFKMVLEELGSKVYIKWPNDFYIIQDNYSKKIGGTITTFKRDKLICGIGVNTNTTPVNSNDKFGKLDIDIDKKQALEQLIKYISKKLLWKDVFNKFSVEFHKHKNDTFTYTFIENGITKNLKVSLSQATLNNDGSINYLGKTIINSR